MDNSNTIAAHSENIHKLLLQAVKDRNLRRINNLLIKEACPLVLFSTPFNKRKREENECNISFKVQKLCDESGDDDFQDEKEIKEIGKTRSLKTIYRTYS